MHTIEATDGSPDFQSALLAIAQDPEIRRLALRLAGDLELAEDARQEAYYAVRRVRNPEEIKDLRAYFCTVLANKVRRLRGQLREAVLVEDFEHLAETHQEPAVTRLRSRRQSVC